MNAPLLTRPRPDSTTATETDLFLDDVLDGLSHRQKTLPAKYFYDLEGSRLFEDITHLAEYYPTRTELGILRDHAAEIGSLCPPRSAVVEFGAGSTEKIRTLLSGLTGVGAYVPIDVSAEFVRGEADRLRADLPEIEVVPVVGDFTRDLALPGAIAGLPRVGFFPGSTVGNFEPDAARDLLRRFAELLGPDALLIVGVDLVKDDAILNAAYDDREGVTARFNLNLLTRINRELGADFDVAQFRHRAFFDRDRSRIEMHLVSRCSQTVRVAGSAFDFGQGETIHTENSYKYTTQSFATLAAAAGWSVARALTDPDRLFAVFALRAA